MLGAAYKEAVINRVMQFAAVGGRYAATSTA